MRRFYILAWIVGVIATLALAGCGGGGGTTTNVTPPQILGERVITGKVVSSQTGLPGVANVVVILGNGDAYATTTSTGEFQLKLAAGTAEIPAYIQIDPTGAGAGFSKSYPITYNGQQFGASSITVPVGIRNEATNSLGTYTLPYVGADDVPPMPYVSKDTVLTGRIIRYDNLAGIANVTVRFGTPTFTATTGKNGYFELNLGRDTVVLSVLPGSQIFSIDTSTAGSGYPSSLTVLYEGTTSAQSAIPVPSYIPAALGTDFGNIAVVITSSGGGDGPPGPPL